MADALLCVFPVLILFLRVKSETASLQCGVSELDLTRALLFQEHPDSSSDPNHALRSALPAPATSHSTATHNSPLVPNPHAKYPALEKRGFHESFTKAKPGSYKIPAVAARESAAKVTEQGLWEPQSKNGTQEQDPGLVDLDDASLPVSDV